MWLYHDTELVEAVGSARPEAGAVTPARAARAWFDSLPGPVRGAAWMTVSGALFSFNAAAVRHVAGEVNGIEVAFFRSLFAFTAVALLILPPIKALLGRRPSAPASV